MFVCCFTGIRFTSTSFTSIGIANVNANVQINLNASGLADCIDRLPYSFSFSCFTRLTCLNSLIAAVDLGPGFLDNEDPDLMDVILALRWSRKGPAAAFLIIWEVVVDCDNALFTVDVQLNSVTARIVDLCC